jgi:GT2 family glycosyltransferase
VLEPAQLLDLVFPQAGVAAMSKSSKYVLFLDDDIRVHPGTVGQLVACLEKEPEVRSFQMFQSY